jgi:hypothetical protein
LFFSLKGPLWAGFSTDYPDRTTPLEFAGGFIQGAIACGMNLFWENTLLLTKTVFLFSIHIYFLAWEICPDEDTEAGDKPVEPSQSGPYVLTMVMK